MINLMTLSRKRGSATTSRKVMRWFLEEERVWVPVDVVKRKTDTTLFPVLLCQRG